MAAAEWVSHIRSLHDFLSRNDSQRSLLAKIDQGYKSLTSSKGNSCKLAEQIICSSMAEIFSLYEADMAILYIRIGDIFFPSFLLPGESQHGQLPRNIMPDVRESEDHAHPVYSQYIDRNSNSIAVEVGMDTVILTPLFDGGKDPFAFIVLGSKRERERSWLADPSTAEFVSHVGVQLSNLLRFERESRQASLAASLTDVFFRKVIDRRESFAEMIQHVNDYLPSFSPLILEPKPQIQLLVYEPNSDYFTIAATSGFEPDYTRVSIHRSFCGRLISQPNLYPDFRLDDPRKDPEYKAYLGEDMLSELAVRISWRDETVGVLNLESPVRDAFKAPHIEAIQGACQQLGPMVDAFINHTRIVHDSQRALSSATTSYLQQGADNLWHEVRTPLATILDRVKRLDASILEKDASKRYVRSIKNSQEKIHSSIMKFVEDVEGFSRSGPIDLRELLVRICQRTQNEEDLELRDRNISLTLEIIEDGKVDATKLLEQHLSELIRNAVYSVKKRVDEKGPEPRGKILIKLDRERPSTGKKQEVNLNERCVIIIWDNGLGASKEVIAKLGWERFTSKGKEGSGYGVKAVRDYAESLRGSMEFRSEVGEFFEATMKLDALI